MGRPLPAGARSRPRVGKAYLVWLGIAISAGFTYLAIRGVKFDDVWTGLRESNYWWLIPSLALLVVALPLRALRWQYLFSAETRPPYRPVLYATILGQLFNNILPARAGEAARVVALSVGANVSTAETFTTVLVERLYDVLALLVMLFLLLPWLPHVTWVHAAAGLAIGLTAITVAVVVLLAIFGDRPVRWVLRPLARLPFLSLERTERAAASFVRGAASLRDPKLAAIAFVLTAVSWILLGLSTWVLMIGFHFGLSPLAGGLVTVAVGLSLVIPSSPAAVGVFETAALIGLEAYGIDKSDALPYALVLHAVNFFPYVIAGLIVLQAHALTPRKKEA